MGREVELNIHRLREFTATIGQHLNAATNLLRFPPGTHNKRIIDRHTRDGVDPFGLDRIGILNESRQVRIRAGRRERTWNTKKDHFLPPRRSSVLTADGPESVISKSVALGILSPTLMVMASSLNLNTFGPRGRKRSLARAECSR